MFAAILLITLLDNIFAQAVKKRRTAWVTHSHQTQHILLSPVNTVLIHYQIKKIVRVAIATESAVHHSEKITHFIECLGHISRHKIRILHKRRHDPESVGKIMERFKVASVGVEHLTPVE